MVFINGSIRLSGRIYNNDNQPYQVGSTDNSGNGSSGSSGVTSFLDLTDTPTTSLQNNIGKFVRVRDSTPYILEFADVDVTQTWNDTDTGNDNKSGMPLYLVNNPDTLRGVLGAKLIMEGNLRIGSEDDTSDSVINIGKEYDSDAAAMLKTEYNSDSSKYKFIIKNNDTGAELLFDSNKEIKIKDSLSSNALVISEIWRFIYRKKISNQRIYSIKKYTGSK